MRATCCRAKQRERQVAAREFYQGIYTTALAENELLTEVRIPTPATGARHVVPEDKAQDRRLRHRSNRCDPVDVEWPMHRRS